jgi:N-methylhydantoinase A
MARFKVGIDVGGTFTDLTAVEMETGRLVASCKVPSTPGDFVKGVMNVLKKSELQPSHVEMIIHGTTIGTNSIIERKGAETILITTHGFRDVLLAQRGGREQIYDLDWQPQLPPIKRRDIFTVRERIDYRGKVVTPLNEEDVREVARAVGKRGIESIGICFVNSFVNPSHEIQARRVLERELPNVPVCISYELAPVMKEYERTNSTVQVPGYLGGRNSGGRLQERTADHPLRWGRHDHQCHETYPCPDLYLGTCCRGYGWAHVWQIRGFQERHYPGHGGDQHRCISV